MYGSIGIRFPFLRPTPHGSDPFLFLNKWYVERARGDVALVLSKLLSRFTRLAAWLSKEVFA